MFWLVRTSYSPDANVSSLPTFALLLGRSDNGRPIFCAEGSKRPIIALKIHFFRATNAGKAVGAGPYESILPSMMLSNTAHRAAAPSRRLFSLARANRSLPLVRRIVADIQQASGRVADYQEEFERLAELQNLEQANQAIMGLRGARKEYRQFCRELDQLGCSLADERAGAVDFPAVVDGKQVVLCWRMGETQISRWHDPGW